MICRLICALPNRRFGRLETLDTKAVISWACIGRNKDWTSPSDRRDQLRRKRQGNVKRRKLLGRTETRRSRKVQSELLEKKKMRLVKSNEGWMKDGGDENLKRSK
jgi:hypothetical protein